MDLEPIELLETSELDSRRIINFYKNIINFDNGNRSFIIKIIINLVEYQHGYIDQFLSDLGDECYYNNDIRLKVFCNADFISNRLLNNDRTIIDCVVSDIKNFKLNIEFKQKENQDELVNYLNFPINKLINDMTIYIYKNENIISDIIKIKYDKSLYFTYRNKRINSLLDVKDTNLIYISEYTLMKIFSIPCLESLKIVYNIFEDNNYDLLFENVFARLDPNDIYRCVTSNPTVEIFNFMNNIDLYGFKLRIPNLLIMSIIKYPYYSDLIKFIHSKYPDQFIEWFTLKRFDDRGTSNKKILFMDFIKNNIYFDGIKQIFKKFNLIAFEIDEIISILEYLKKQNLKVKVYFYIKYCHHIDNNKFKKLLDLNNYGFIKLNLIEYLRNIDFMHDTLDNVHELFDIIIDKDKKLLNFINDKIIYSIGICSEKILIKIFKHLGNIDISNFQIPLSSDFSLSVIEYCYRVNKFIPFKRVGEIENLEQFKLYWKYLEDFKCEKRNFNKLYMVTYDKFDDYIINNCDLNNFSYEKNDTFEKLGKFYSKLIEFNQKKTKSARNY